MQEESEIINLLILFVKHGSSHLSIMWESFNSDKIKEDLILYLFDKIYENIVLYL